MKFQFQALVHLFHFLLLNLAIGYIFILIKIKKTLKFEIIFKSQSYFKNKVYNFNNFNNFKVSKFQFNSKKSFHFIFNFLFQMTMPPSNTYRGIIAGVTVLHFFVAYLVEVKTNYGNNNNIIIINFSKRRYLISITLCSHELMA